MATEKDILKKFEGLKNNPQFEVPDKYFEILPGKILDQIKASENKVEELKKKPVFAIIRNQLAIAASFAALFLLAYTGIKIIAPEKSAGVLSENEIFASLELEILELDEEILYSLAMNESIIIPETSELTDQEIVDYLMEEGAELDLTINDF